MPITLPSKWVAGRASEVTAVLPLLSHSRTVEATVTLEAPPGSIPASVSTVEEVVRDGVVIARWSVTPTEAGTLNLLFHTALSAQAGEQTLKAEVDTARSVAVSESFWSRSVGFFTGVGAVVAALVGIVGLIAAVRKWRSSASADG